MILTPARRAAAIAAGAAAVLLLGVLTFLTTRRGRDAAAWVGHTYEVLATLESLGGRAVDAETGVRGFAATREPRFLEPYDRAERDVARELARLRRLTADNPAQDARLDTLEVRLGATFAHLDSAVARTRARPRAQPEMSAELAAGKAHMDAVRAAVASVGAEERRLLAARRADDDRLRAVTGWVVLAETLAAAGCVAAVGLLLGAAARAEQRHAAAEHAARVDAERLRAEAEAGARQLGEQAAELETLNAELQDQAVALEERTAQAERANRARADFLASMSHELRTPLNAIRGYLHLLSEGVYGPVTDAQQDAVARAMRAEAHLLGMVEDVLQFTRLAEGRVAFDVGPVPLADVVRDVLPIVEPQLQAKGLALQLRLPGPPAGGLRVLADRSKLAQVLVNLLANAVKFTPARQPDGAPGAVTIEVGERAEGSAPGDPALVYVQVHDTGIGIPRDQQDAVFEPFVQVSTGLTRAAEGTGLGLAISRDLARGMGGDLRLRSTPGVGSTFTVTLRRAEAEGTADV